MKPRTFIPMPIAILLLFCAAIGRAQEPGTQVGIGISLDPTRLFLAGSNFYSNVLTPVNIYVPIGGPQFRFEPEIGYFSYSYESSLAQSKSENDASIFHVGGGVFYVISTNTPVRVYVGPRVGFNFVSSKSSSSTQFGSYSSESSETDFTIGMNVGGEYLLGPQFSVGGEAQLNYISLGKPEVTTSPAQPVTGSDADVKRHIINSNVLFFFRWFF